MIGMWHRGTGPGLVPRQPHPQCTTLYGSFQMKEVWKDTYLTQDYMVSSLGRVLSKKRLVNCGPPPGTREIPGKILNPFNNNQTGYLQVKIGKHGKQSVHALVARTFLLNYRDGLVCNHKNGIKTDNNLHNLEIVTHSENHLHSYAVLGRKGSWFGRFGKDHPTSKAVISTDIITGEERHYDCSLRAVDEGFNSGTISHCCHGTYSQHKGRTWRFAK